MAKNYRSKVMAAIHETAADLRSVGGLDQKTMHKFDKLCLTPVKNVTRMDRAAAARHR